MAEAVVGRLLVASLHQGIADIDPTRLEFYEPWLRPSGLRERRVGLAPLNAALSFLRLEGRETYERIMVGAGRYSADWTFENRSPLERALIRRLPAAWRARSALTLGRQVVKGTFDGAHTKVRLRRGQGTIEIASSIFCSSRETLPAPTCVYYAAAFERALALMRLDGAVRIRSCRAAGGDACTLDVTIDGASRAPVDVEAA
jgi:hypothetical protein